MSRSRSAATPVVSARGGGGDDDGTAERRLAERILEQIRTTTGATGVALYLSVAGGPRRELVVGEGRFPRIWKPDDSGGLASCALEGALLAGEAPQLAPSPAERLAVEAAARSLLLTRRLREQSFAVHYHGVEMQALYDVGLAIASTLDLEPLADQILMHAVALLDARRGALYLRDGGILRLHGAVGGEAAPEIEPAAAGLEGLPDPADQRAPRLLPGAEHLCAAPIGEVEAPRGLLIVAEKESRNGVGPFAAGDRQTLMLLANQAAIALETAQLHREALATRGLERELDLAAEIQRRLLPSRLPEPPGWELYGASRPARQVGGDWYDVMTAPEEPMTLVLGDVSGKGMPAALMVSTLHAGLRLFAGREELDQMVERCNAYLLEASASNRFVTLFLARLDLRGGRLSYLNAGHEPGLVVGTDGAVRRLGANGVPVGMLPGSRWRVCEETLAAGEVLCLYSDGLTEAASPDGEEFGLERLQRALVELRERPLQELADDLDRRISEFGGGAAPGDDQTLLLARRVGGGGLSRPAGDR